MSLNYPKSRHISYLAFILLLVAAFLLQGFTSKPASKPAKKEDNAPFQLYSAFVNFQNSAVKAPNGFDKDYGKAFGYSTVSAIGKEFAYGWKNATNNSPIDISEEASGNGDGTGRNRLGASYNAASTTNQIEGTFIHLQGENVSGWENQPRGQELYWELEVPNGFMEVTISLGDKGPYTQSRHSATVEGYSILAAFEPQSGQTRKATMLVKVDDGAITINGLGGYNSKINYIEVHEILDDEEAANKTLAFEPQSKNLSLINGESKGVITSSLSGAGAGTIGLVIQDDLQVKNDRLSNANDWLQLPSDFKTGKLRFAVNATGMQTGDTRKSTIVATAAGFKPAVFEASLNIIAGCSPLSLVPCDQLLREMPLTLDFNGNGNGLPDAKGTSTGFTVATPHSRARLPQDKTASYPGINGYEPSKINISGGQLQLTATKGIATSNENRQINTLGVALQEFTPTFQIETKILNLNMPANGDAQTGINFGFNEDNYVKLVILNGNSIQLKSEINGITLDGLNNAGTITAQNLDLANKNVTLRLLFDTTEGTVAATYAIGESDFVTLSAANQNMLAIPASLFTGRTAPIEVKGASLAGIFALYNKASTDFNATFDYFKISAPSGPTLHLNPADALLTKIKVYPNPVKEQLNISLPQSIDLQKISIYDVQGRTITSHAASAVQTGTGYRVNTANLSAGIYLIELQQKNGNKVPLKFVKSN